MRLSPTQLNLPLKIETARNGRLTTATSCLLLVSRRGLACGSHYTFADESMPLWVSHRDKLFTLLGLA